MFTEMDIQIDSFMMYCESKNLTKKTMASYEQTLRLFATYLKNEFNITEPSEVKTAHVRNYIAYLRERGKYTIVGDVKTKSLNNPDIRSDRGKPISDTTIANYLRNIKVFFNFLAEEREIKENPTAKVKNIKPTRKQKKLLRPEEIKRLLSAFDVTTFHGYRSWLMIRLMLDTVIRIGECVSLRPEHVDFKERSILITNPKNHRQRYVYFSNKLSIDLKRWFQYRDRYSDSEYLFPTVRGGMQDVSSFEKLIKKAANSVSIDVTPHQLRNNFAKYYLLNGGDFVTLSRILGHSSVEVTQKAYLDFAEDEVAKKYRKHSPFNNWNF